MPAPAFEEFDPTGDCDCAGCVHWRRVLPHSATGHGSRHPAARRVLVVAAAALAAGQAAPALAAPHAAQRPDLPPDDEATSPQGGPAPLHGSAGRPRPAPGTVVPAITRAEIIKRAKKWVEAKVPYSMSRFWSDGYRQDCSGFVSMAWKLPGNEWTGSLGQYGVRVSKDDLLPGDMLLFHNPENPQNGSHVVIFGGWTDHTHTSYIAYESTRPHARKQTTPYAYWNNSDRYLAYRYKGLAAGTGTPGAEPSASAARPYPGAAYFGPGAHNKHVAELGRMLAARGAGRFYASGPGPRWTDADRRATRAFQRAQGWTGDDADGLPGPRTWTLLVTGEGKDITTGAAAPAAPASHGVPGYPGRAMFRPGAANEYVTQLRRQLVRKGFGTHYTTGQGPRWSEADRRGVEAFQRSQGWRGGAADGYPGPETWRRLFALHLPGG
ncbi:peptidoglycan-binding protein [Streptomyces sp. NBC_00445]|uniref:peptidoglycan-binding protein n=1 Tax=Streptomyces sp. NBC_00445 TaxID=2975745 RepID=UPI002E1ECFD2